MSSEHAPRAADVPPKIEAVNTTQSAILTISPRGTGADEVGGGDVPEFTGPVGYVLLEEIGRGGMGIVYRAVDVGLNREVAVKILRISFAPISNTSIRFVEEGRITGQLQHPGIPAVHQIGTLPDGRPFLAMKLIKGKTLDALLKAGELASLNYLAVFEAICQGVAYAHAHRVIHRDLKPANIMVGAFGEVQVMDWGLAKVLSDEAGPPNCGNELTVADAHGTEIFSRADCDTSFTQVGSVIGTPAFMPPEQAGGEVEKIDRCADVFSLGAILCVILTGEPPFHGKNRDSIRLNAVRGNLDEAYSRLDECGAEPDLIILAKKCLSFAPHNRPADAGELAEAVHALRAAADERAKNAEMEQARTEVRIVEQRKRRRVQLALAGSFLLIVLGIGGAMWWHQATRSAAESVRATREAKTTFTTDAALDDARERATEAWEQSENPERMQSAADLAIGAVRRAEGFVTTGEPTEELRRRLAEVRLEVEVVHRHARLFLSAERALEEHAEPTDGRSYSGQTGKRLRAAYREFGLDPDSTPAAQAADEIARSRVRNKLLGYLSDWDFQGGGAWVRDVIAQTRTRAGGVLGKWQAVLIRQEFTELANLTATDDILALGPQLLCAIGRDLESNRQTTARLLLLRRAVARYPTNLWLRYDLWRVCLDSPPQRRFEAFQQAAAMTALRPKSAQFQLHLGEALASLDENDRAAEAYTEAVRLVPNFAAAQAKLRPALSRKVDHLASIAAFQQEVLTNPNAIAYNNLGFALMQLGRWSEAIPELKQANRLDPSFVPVRRNLTTALKQVVRLNPIDAASRYDLGIHLIGESQLEEAEVELKEAVRLNPRFASPHIELGKLLTRKGNKLGAIDEFKQAVQLEPKDAIARQEFGLSLWNVSQWKEAESELNEAVRLAPRSTEARLLLGRLHWSSENKDRAIAAYEEAFRLDPKATTDAIVDWQFHRREPFFALRLLESIAPIYPSMEADPRSGIRYACACCAVLAAAGAEGTPPTEDRSALRRKGLDWLSVDLKAWQKLLAASSNVRPEAHTTMNDWLKSYNLRSVRDRGLEQLPSVEQSDWTTFWLQVRKLRDETAR